MGQPRRAVAHPRAFLFVILLCFGCVAAADKLSELCQTPSNDVSATLQCSATRSTSVYSPYELELEIPGNGDGFDLSVVARGIGSSSLGLELSVDNKPLASSKGDLSEASLVIARENMKSGASMLRVTTKSLIAEFTLSIAGQTSRPALAAPDKAALKAFYTACCTGPSMVGPGPFQSFICDNLNTWTNAAAGSDDDFCNTAPNLCDAQGRILKAFFRADRPGALSFTCRTPPAGIFANFTKLQSLDISNQNLFWSFKDLTAALQGSALERLFVHSTQISGNLNIDGCAFLKAVPSLNTLWAGNNKFVGDIPACFITHPFEQLRLNLNMLGGELPDKFLPDSPLEVLDLNQQNAQYNSMGGPIPSTISLLKRLLVLNLASNDFTGQIPELPTTLEELALSNNKFSGTLPASLGQMTDLVMVHIGLGRADDKGKKITGPLPAGFEKLPKLVFAYLSNNTLTGTLDRDWNMPAMQRLSLSINNFEGPIPAKLASGCPQMRFLRLGTNQLTGTLDAYANALPSPNYIVGFNVTVNKLTGGLPEGMKKLAVFTNLSFPITGEFDYLTGAPITFKNVLVLTQNKFDSPYPMWIPEALSTLPNTSVQLQDSDDTNNWQCPKKGEGVSSEAFTVVAQSQDQLLCRQDSKVVELSSVVSLTSESREISSQSGRTGTTISSQGGSSSSEKKKSGLGAGAIAGIAIALVVVLAIIAGVTFFLLKKKPQPAAKFQEFQGPDSGVKPMEVSQV